MKLIKFLLSPFIFLVVWFIRWKGNIRFGEIWSGRLGHLIGNTECYLGERDSGKHKDFIDIWFSRPLSSNKVIERKYRKQLHTLPEWFCKWVVLCNRMLRGWERYEIAPLQFDRDIENLWKGPYLSFTKREEEKGKNLLKKLGIKTKWVCLMVRDEAYLREMGDFSYHNYRDSDPSTYLPAVVELLSRGYTVIRMGVKVDKPLKIKHERFIDYAWEGLRTDFSDLYLGAKCEFAVGTACGFLSIPQAFERPIVFVNHVPLEYIPTSNEKALLIWKHHKKDGKRMSLPEIFDSNLGQITVGHLFNDFGVILEDNSSIEIHEVVKEMCDHMDGVKWGGLQPEFWSKFPITARSPFNGRPLHGKPLMRVGKEFLKGYV